ncbi:hypothetical protein GS531_00565 [Rhodococcus hoagii]|nr:hypothetical protein [Prescottella equi]
MSGFRFGSWVSTRCRRAHTQGDLPADRAAELEQIPGWTWARSLETRDSPWDRGIKQLAAWVDEHGHARVPQQARYQGATLGTWVANRRREFKAGKLSPERIAQLEAFPGWEWNAGTLTWAKGMQLLYVWATAHGHTNVPASETVDGHKLGTWVAARRRERSRGKMGIVKVAELESIPHWTWIAAPPRHVQTPWRRWAATNQSYAATTGTVGTALGVLGPLPDEAEWLPGMRDAFAWWQGISALRTWLDAHGPGDIPTTATVGDFWLGEWIVNRLGDHRAGRLQRDQAMELEGLLPLITGPVAPEALRALPSTEAAS